MGTLECRIELKKESGLTLTTTDAEGKTTRTIVLDDTSITMTVKGQSKTSTIVQTDENVEITCTNFKVTADKVTVNAKDGAAVESKKAIDLKGDEVSVSAQKDVGITGKNTNIESKAISSVKGKKVDVEAKAGVEIKGNLVKVDSKASLTLEAKGIASLKGSMAKVGTMVKLG